MYLGETMDLIYQQLGEMVFIRWMLAGGDPDVSSARGSEAEAEGGGGFVGCTWEC